MSERKLAIDWAKKHKKSFARKLIRDSGAQKLAKPAAIFMAGLPGAGKTEFTRNLVRNLHVKLVRLDMDEIATQIDSYSAAQADKFRGAASMLLDRTFDMVVHGGYNFIMDGTFGSDSVLRDLDRALKHGYTVKVIYLYQSPKVAWKYTVAREKVEYRAIDKDGFVKAYYKTWENLQKLYKFRGLNVSLDLVIKDGANEIESVIEDISIKDIASSVKIEYNEGVLRKSICE